jgi:hypothetical protein
MKDSVLRACLLLWCWLPFMAAGQPIFNNAGQVLGNGQLFQGGQPTLIMPRTVTSGTPEMMPEPRSDVVEFVDGSALHGQMTRMDVEHGLTWVSPEAKNPIRFRPDHLDSVRFAHANSVSLSPTCHLWFANGDDLYGSITSLDNEKVGFSTWFGGSMVIPRSAVRSVTFLSPHYSVMYEGPYDEGGWLVVNNFAKSWTFQDRAFVGSGQGTLARDLNLTNSATVEFDLSWNGTFSLGVGIYCDVTDRLEVNGGSCFVDVTPNRINLRSIQNNMGFPFNATGVPIPENEGKNRMHVAIECDKSEGTASIFVNHTLAKTWKDCNFQGGGTGIVFMQQAIMFGSGGSVRLSHLKVSQWEGRSEPETFDAASTNDAIHFVNHDQAAGNIESIQNGKARLNLSGTVLDIPLERVTQIEFAAEKTTTESPGPWQVRAHFPGGGSVSFQLEKWDGNAVSGQSLIFGSLAFQPTAIREMEFNLNRPKEGPIVNEDKEFEGLDE